MEGVRGSRNGGKVEATQRKNERNPRSSVSLDGNLLLYFHNGLINRKAPLLQTFNFN